MQKDNLRRLAITTALTSGDNTLVAAAQLGTGIGSIRVCSLNLRPMRVKSSSPSLAQRPFRERLS